LSDEEVLQILDNFQLIGLPYGRTQESVKWPLSEFALLNTCKTGGLFVFPPQIFFFLGDVWGFCVHPSSKRGGICLTRGFGGKPFLKEFVRDKKGLF